MDKFWETVDAQLAELRSAKSADDVLRILSLERNPYGPGSASGDGFFAGGDGGEMLEALADAGWSLEWIEADYHWRMRAPNGDKIKYVEGDIYRG
jgi:hypothetical protein